MRAWTVFRKAWSLSIHIAVRLLTVFWRTIAIRRLRTTINAAAVVAMFLAVGIRWPVLVAMPRAIISAPIVMATFSSTVRTTDLATAMGAMRRTL